MNQSLPSSADTEVVRPYTPVDQRLAAGPDPPSQEPDLYLMIKVYPDGVFTQHLNSLQTGERPRHFCLQAVVSPSVFCCAVFDDDSFHDLQCHRTFFLELESASVFYCKHQRFLSKGDHISVSGPEGSFSVRLLRDVTHLFLLAAGTGFTPMARLIRLSLQEIDTIRWGQLTNAHRL